MKRKYFLIPILSLASLIFFYSAAIFLPVSAQEKGARTRAESKVEISDVKIESRGDSLEISAVVSNPSDSVASPEVTHLLILENIDPLIPAKDERDILPSLIVNAEEGKEYFSLRPGEKKSVSYVLPANSRIPQSNYSLLIKFIRSSGQTEAYARKTLPDFGSDKKEGFLAFDQENCFVLGKDGKNYGSNDGPVFSSDDSPKVNCVVKNIGKSAVAVSPKIILKEFYVYGKPLQGTAVVEKQSEKISFKAGETKTVALFMPKAEKPQTYQALLSFEDESGTPVSFNMPFRWTIGGESARIKDVSQVGRLKKDYSKGDKISLSVNYFGSSDLFWADAGQIVSNLPNLTMKTTIKDGEGNVCGQKEEILPSVTDGEEKNKITEIILSKKCAGASYSATLFSGGKNLAGQSGGLLKLVKENKFSVYKNIIWLFIFAFWVYVFFLVRKKSAMKYIFFFILFLSASAVFGAALAASVKIYPDEGGTTGKGNWWGDWSLTGGTATLKSNPSGGGGLNNLKVYDAEVDFDDYINAINNQRIKVYINYKAADNSCANTNMKVGIKMFLSGDNISKTAIGFAKDSSTSWGNEKRYFYDNEDTNAIIEKTFNINPADIKRFYDTNGKFTVENPKLVIEMRQAGYNGHEGKFSQGYFTDEDKDTTLRTEDEAFNRSGIIRIMVPFNLPSPEITSFTASPASLSCSGNSTLSWTAKDMDSCTASASPANSQWQGSKSKSGGSQTITGITETTKFTLNCSKQIGSAGTFEYSKPATVVATCIRPALDVSCSADMTTADVGQNVKWTANIDPDKKGSPPYNYTWSETVSGSLNSTTATSYSTTTSYTTTGTKKATISVTDYADKIAENSCYVTIEKKPKLKLTTTECGSVTATGNGESQTVQNNANNEPGWSYNKDTSLFLTATPSSGDSFTGWSGDGSCTGANSTCSLTMSEDKEVKANFECAEVVIPPSLVCNNNGAQDNGESGIDCGGGNCPTCGTTPPGDPPSGDPPSGDPPPSSDQCGSSNNICVNGTLSDITDSATQYIWQCGSLSCTAPIDGGGNPPNACGTEKETCTPTGGAYSDTPADTADYYYWSCGSLQCSASTAGNTSDQCGSKENCDYGTKTDLTDSDTQYLWQCGKMSCSSSKSGSGGTVTVSASVSSVSASVINNLPTDSSIAKIKLELDDTAQDQDKISLTADLSGIGGASGALSSDCNKNDKKIMAFYSIDSGSNWSCYKGAVSIIPESLGGTGTAELWIKIHYISSDIFTRGLTMPITIPVNISDDNGYVISPSTLNLNLTVKKITTQWQEI